MTRRKTGVRVEVGPDRESDEARIKRATVVETSVKKNVRYLNDAAFRMAMDELVASGVALRDSGRKVSVLEMLLAQARANHVEQRQAYDHSYDTATAYVEKTSLTEPDVIDCGFDVLHRENHGLALPSELTARYDRGKDVMSIHVKYPWRNEHCVVEVSNAPDGEGPFERLTGTGVTRKLKHPAPGIWWVRAATVRATGQSDWYGPVAVVVT